MKTNQIVIWPTWHHFGRKTNWSIPKKNILNESSWFVEPKCKLWSKVAHFFVLFCFTVFFNLSCSNSVRMEDMLWIEDIVESILAPSFWINSRIHMASFVDPHKLVARKINFQFFQVHKKIENKKPKKHQRKKKEERRNQRLT